MHTSKQHKNKNWLWCLKLSRNKTKVQASNEFKNRIIKKDKTSSSSKSKVSSN
jgi:hypothetical protein